MASKITLYSEFELIQEVKIYVKPEFKSKVQFLSIKNHT